MSYILFLTHSSFTYQHLPLYCVNKYVKSVQKPNYRVLMLKVVTCVLKGNASPAL